MALFEKWEEAWNKNDAAAWIALLHEDYQFKFHSNGKVMKKSDMTHEMSVVSFCIAMCRMVLTPKAAIRMN